MISRLSTFSLMKDPATTELYTLSLHDALPILCRPREAAGRHHDHRRRRSGEAARACQHRGSRGHALAQRSEEHTSELQSRFDLVCRLLLEKKNEMVRHPESHTTR